jgi:hypothetical protein
LNDFPVFSIGVEEVYQGQVFLNSPLVFAEVGSQVIFVMVFELLVVAV